MKTLRVTEWNIPGADMKLILAGTESETLEEAKQYAAPDSHEELKANERDMPVSEFEALPEFDG